MPYSHHSHSGQFCRHAAQGTSLEDVVKEALRKGFKVYGLSEHAPRSRQADFYPEESDLTPADLYSTYQSFLEEAWRLKREYADRIDLLVGLETDYILPGDRNEVEDLIRGSWQIEAADSEVLDKSLGGASSQGEASSSRRPRGGIEYVVGSVHHVKTIPIDFDVSTYERSVASFVPRDSEPSHNEGFRVTPSNFKDPRISQALTGYFIAYFDAQYELLQALKPAVVGHFDLCRLYTPYIRFCRHASHSDIDTSNASCDGFPGIWHAIERNVKLVIEGGWGLFELNAASFRKGWDEAYPGSEIVELIRDSGGRFCLSDDSHGPAAVGLNYRRLVEYVKQHRLENCVYYLASNSGGTNSETNPQNLEVRRMPDGWTDDGFWGQLP